jgi:hypothetical protein
LATEHELTELGTADQQALEQLRELLGDNPVIDSIRAGEFRNVTPREFWVVFGAFNDLSVRQIADHRGCCEDTVRSVLKKPDAERLLARLRANKAMKLVKRRVRLDQLVDVSLDGFEKIARGGEGIATNTQLQACAQLADRCSGGELAKKTKVETTVNGKVEVEHRTQLNDMKTLAAELGDRYKRNGGRVINVAVSEAKPVLALEAGVSDEDNEEEIDDHV